MALLFLLRWHRPKEGNFRGVRMHSWIFMIILVLSFTSCASKKEKQEIKQAVAKTTPIKNEAELYSLEQEILEENKNLNQEQKLKLRDLISKNYKENQDIQREIDKTKAVLFKELISSETSKSKIRLLENQILRLNRKKTRTSLSAYKEAKNIVGKNEVPLEKTLNMLDNRTIHEF